MAPIWGGLLLSTLCAQVDIISTSPSVNLSGINSQGTGIYQNLSNNGLPQNNALYLFVEQQNVTLGSNLVVGDIQDGVSYSEGNKPSNKTIASGTTVSSVFLHYNRNNGSGTLSGQFELNREILGFSWASGTGQASLVQSDFLGKPGTIFQSNGGNSRGVFERIDTVTINGSTVDFDLQMTSNYIDQFRLILNATPYYYWDLNGATAGAGGPSPSGVWNSSNAYWSTSIDGTISTSTFAPNNIAVFSAGDDATGAYTIEKNGAESVNGLNFQDGNVSIVDLAGGKGSLSFNTVNGVTPGISVNDGLTGTIAIEIDDNGNGIRKTGTGTLVLATTPNSGTMSISGTTQVFAGTLDFSNSNDSNYITGNVIVNGGSNLILSADNQMSGTANMTIDGGTFTVNNASDALGSLTLDANSTIDFSGSSGVVQFADSSSNAWSGGLIIENWDGSLGGGGAEQLIFGSNVNGLTNQQLQTIFFKNPAGLPSGLYAATILGNGEVVPVLPEPSTYIAGFSMLGILLAHYWRSRKKASRG